MEPVEEKSVKPAIELQRKRRSFLQRVRKSFTTVFRRKSTRKRTTSDPQLPEKQKRLPKQRETVNLSSSLTNVNNQDSKTETVDESEDVTSLETKFRAPAKVPIFVSDLTNELKKSLQLRSKQVAQGDKSPSEAIDRMENLRSSALLEQKDPVSVETETKTFGEKVALFEAKTEKIVKNETKELEGDQGQSPVPDATDTDKGPSRVDPSSNADEIVVTNIDNECHKVEKIEIDRLTGNEKDVKDVGPGPAVSRHTSIDAKKDVYTEIQEEHLHEEKIPHKGNVCNEGKEGTETDIDVSACQHNKVSDPSPADDQNIKIAYESLTNETYHIPQINANEGKETTKGNIRVTTPLVEDKIHGSHGSFEEGAHSVAQEEHPNDGSCSPIQTNMDKSKDTAKVSLSVTTSLVENKTQDFHESFKEASHSEIQGDHPNDGSHLPIQINKDEKKEIIKIDRNDGECQHDDVINDLLEALQDSLKKIQEDIRQKDTADSSSGSLVSPQEGLCKAEKERRSDGNIPKPPVNHEDNKGIIGPASTEVEFAIKGQGIDKLEKNLVESRDPTYNDVINIVCPPPPLSPGPSATGLLDGVCLPSRKQESDSSPSDLSPKNTI